jgi:hypothetical protein
MVLMPASLSRAESVFEDYLGLQNLSWEYEALPGKKKPDYFIHHAQGGCVVEVKAIEDPDPLPVSGFEPDRAVRRKIRKARTQLGEYRDLSCSLAVFSESMFGPHDPSVILAAAFGPGFVEAGRDHSRIDPRPSYYRFSTRSELPSHLQFLSNPLLSPAANTTFSALILLGYHALDKLHLEVWKRLYAKQELGETVEPGDQFRLLSELGPTFRGPRIQTPTPRVVVIENRHARVPFPSDLFRGAFDQRWGWNEEWCGPTWIGTALESLAKDGVPFYML